METDALKIDVTARKEVHEVLADETYLTIRLNERDLVTLTCTPDNLEELSAGFLYSSGLIHSLDDIDDISYDKTNQITRISLNDRSVNPDILFKRIYTSGCGKGMLYQNILDLAHRNPIVNNFRIHPENITVLMKALNERSELFHVTGGTHFAALSDGERITAFSEDIGRHNAIDKIIGKALYRGYDMGKSVVLTSGRISSDVMFKVQKMRSPIIISRGAPTGLAIELANQWNITLVGFARGKRMNVYTARERVP